MKFLAVVGQKWIKQAMIDNFNIDIYRSIDYVHDMTPIGGRTSVQLIAEPGKEDFYIKKGFKVFHMSFAVVV